VTKQMNVESGDRGMVDCRGVGKERSGERDEVQWMKWYAVEVWRQLCDYRRSMAHTTAAAFVLMRMLVVRVPGRIRQTAQRRGATSLVMFRAAFRIAAPDERNEHRR
jgi:hypothetical protein